MSELRAVVDMTPEEFETFANEMRLLVAEQAHLFEFPTQSTVVSTTEARVVGPWLWTDCRAILSRWLEAGLLSFYRVRPSGDLDLSQAEGARALNDPDEWRPGGTSGSVAVYESEKGKQTPWDNCTKCWTGRSLLASDQDVRRPPAAPGCCWRWP